MHHPEADLCESAGPSGKGRAVSDSEVRGAAKLRVIHISADGGAEHVSLTAVIQTS